jgi:hypothetical protein
MKWSAKLFNDLAGSEKNQFRQKLNYFFDFLKDDFLAV